MNDVTCRGKYVDCTKFGGYDPRDPCRETCVNNVRKIALDREYEGDTRYSEVTSGTTSLIYHGRRINV